MRAIRLFALLLGMATMLPAAAHAQIPPCPVGGILPCAGGGVAGLNAFLLTSLPAGTGIFMGVLLLMLFYCGVFLVVGSHDENVLNEMKNAYGFALAGGAVVAFGALIVQSFAPSFTGAHFINPGPSTVIFANTLTYVRILVAMAFVGYITVRGFRLILAQGDESAIQKQRTLLMHAIAGASIALLANSLVTAFAGGASTILADEIRGIANFLLVAFGALAVVAFVVAGMMLIFSFDEGGKDRAKKIMTSSVIAVIVVLTSYVVVNFFLSA